MDNSYNSYGQLSASKREAMDKSDGARSQPDARRAMDYSSNEDIAVGNVCAAVPKSNREVSTPAASNKSTENTERMGPSTHPAAGADARIEKAAAYDEAAKIPTENKEPQRTPETSSDWKSAANEHSSVLRYAMDDELIDISPLPPSINRQQRTSQPGAHAVVTPRQSARSDLASGPYESMPAPTNSATEVRLVDPERGDNTTSTLSGLIEADPIMDGSCKQQARPVLIAKKPHSRTWRIDLLATIGTLLLLGGIVAIGVCGGGFCHKTEATQALPDPVRSPTTYTRDATEIANIEKEIQSVMGGEYFGSGSGSEFKARQKALHWIQYEDPSQLNLSDAQHLLQRFTLALFYFQTTQEESWVECNPPLQSSVGLCFYPEDDPLHVTSTIWGFPWLSGKSECQWAGVLCKEDNLVEELTLRYNRLNGPLPWEISRLTHLHALDLGHNTLTGTLPTELGLLIGKNLTGVILENNMLEGTIPSKLFAPDHRENIVSPPQLDLRRNLFTGTIPTRVGLSKWKRLDFGYNFLHGSLPAELFNLSNMEWLLVGGNKNVAGTLPTQIGQLSTLTNFELGGTGITGTMPSEMALLSELRFLDLSASKLRGAIPDAPYSGMVSLVLLFIDGCYFSGTISTSVGLLSNLSGLHLANNHFSGIIPTEIGRLTNLLDVTLNGNNFTGRSVPEELCANRAVLMNGAHWALAADCTQDATTGAAAMECPAKCCTICCDPKTNICSEN